LFFFFSCSLQQQDKGVDFFMVINIESEMSENEILFSDI